MAGSLRQLYPQQCSRSGRANVLAAISSQHQRKRKRVWQFRLVLAHAPFGFLGGLAICQRWFRSTTEDLFVRLSTFAQCRTTSGAPTWQTSAGTKSLTLEHAPSVLPSLAVRGFGSSRRIVGREDGALQQTDQLFQLCLSSCAARRQKAQGYRYGERGQHEERIDSPERR